MPDPMTPARLDEITALADAATPGPWTYECDHDDCPDDHRFVCGVGPFTSVEHPTPGDIADAEFIAASRTAVPELLSEVRRAREAEAEMTRCRDNAIRAARRDEYATHVDLDDVVTTALDGLYEWDDDIPDPRIVDAVVHAVRPYLARAVERADKAEAEVERLRAQLAETRRITLMEARRIAREEAMRMEDRSLNHARGARCVAYLLTRTIRAEFGGDAAKEA